jgi:hypothetical protein
MPVTNPKKKFPETWPIDGNSGITDQALFYKIILSCEYGT